MDRARRGAPRLIKLGYTGRFGKGEKGHVSSKGRECRSTTLPPSLLSSPLMHQSCKCRSSLGIAACVALGGALGSLMRWLTAMAIGSTSGLVAVNVIGCVLIGVLYGHLDACHKSLWWVNPLLGTGFLGGFTTFSSAILLTSSLAESAQWGPVIGLIVGLPITCVIGVWLGQLIARQRAGTTESIQ